MSERKGGGLRCTNHSTEKNSVVLRNKAESFVKELRGEQASECKMKDSKV